MSLPKLALFVETNVGIRVSLARLSCSSVALLDGGVGSSLRMSVTSRCRLSGIGVEVVLASFRVLLGALLEFRECKGADR